MADFWERKPVSAGAENCQRELGPAAGLSLLSPTWCKVVKARKAARMNENRSQGRSRKAQSKAAVRASISFPPDLYETLEQIAKEKKVSLAWVVRDASEKYAADQKPVVREK